MQKCANRLLTHGNLCATIISKQHYRIYSYPYSHGNIALFGCQAIFFKKTEQIKKGRCNIKYINDLISSKEIASWIPDKPILLPAQTGQGKTYWVSHGLYDYLKQNGPNCLYLIQRVRTKEQQQLTNFSGKENTVTVETYQSIEQKLLRNKSIGYYDFIVCDEAHYFTNDVSFNHNTDISFDWIMKQYSVKVFMSATLESLRHRLLNSMGTAFLVHKPLPYKQDYRRQAKMDTRRH